MASHVQSRIGSNALAFSSNITAGNLLIAALASGIAGDTLTVSDSLGQTWTPISATFSAPSSVAMRVFYVQNCASGACTVTGTGTAGVDIVIVEVSGCATASALDVEAHNSGGTANGSSGNATTTSAGFLFGIIANDTGNITLASPITERNVQSNNVRVDSGDSTSVAASTSVNCSATFSARNWCAQVVNFKNAGGGGGGSAFPHLYYARLRG
jgi:hypothetical protein